MTLPVHNNQGERVQGPIAGRTRQTGKKNTRKPKDSLFSVDIIHSLRKENADLALLP